MSAKNDITGDPIQSKILSKEGRDRWDDIFKKNGVTVNTNNNSEKTHAVLISKTYLADNAVDAVLEILSDECEVGENCERVMIERLGLNCGRVLCSNRAAYLDLKPDDDVIFDASIFTVDLGRLWYGDINFTEDKDKLSLVANNLKSDIYILSESEGRWESHSMDRSRLESVAKHIIRYNDKTNILGH